MKFTEISKIFLILCMPPLIFLLAADFVAFDQPFYQQKFIDYGVDRGLPNFQSLHKNVIDFISGKTSNLANDFNQREKKHLMDVKKLVITGKIIMLSLIFSFAIILFVCSMKFKSGSNMKNFAGKMLISGGILTIIIGILLLFFIKSDFQSAFESFHEFLFQKGTYSFDPQKEVIVNLYPEQLFMDLGIRIAKFASIASGLSILAGLFLIANKNKNNKKAVVFC